MSEHQTKMYVIIIENRDGSHGVLEFAEDFQDLSEKLKDEKYKSLKHVVFMDKGWADLSGEAIMEARSILKEMTGVEAAFFDDVVTRVAQELHELRRRHNGGEPLEVIEGPDGKPMWKPEAEIVSTGEHLRGGV